MIVVGQTAGAPVGAFIAGRLFRAHVPAQAILQISAVLLVVGILVFLVVNSSVKRRVRGDAQPLSGGAPASMPQRAVSSRPRADVTVNGTAPARSAAHRTRR